MMYLPIKDGDFPASHVSFGGSRRYSNSSAWPLQQKARKQEVKAHSKASSAIEQWPVHPGDLLHEEIIPPSYTGIIMNIMSHYEPYHKDLYEPISTWHIWS